MTEPAAESLAKLRLEIDRIDAAMHAQLIERGRIIDRLITIKTEQGGGSAFRPAREASMMRALVERHEGHLPVDTVESVWRIIISTFTYLQSPYSVHVDVSRGDAAMRDSARFHFGFTVPCAPHMSAVAVIDAVAEATNDLGMLAVDAGPGVGAWWLRLVGPEAPKIIARLPFVERPDHPAGLPIFVVAKPVADGAARDVVIEAVTVDRWRGEFPQAIAALGGEIVGNAVERGAVSLLVARPGGLPEAAAGDALTRAGATGARSHEVGAHAARYDRSKSSPRRA